jgi:hypothetical protein
MIFLTKIVKNRYNLYLSTEHYDLNGFRLGVTTDSAHAECSDAVVKMERISILNFLTSLAVSRCDPRYYTLCLRN